MNPENIENIIKKAINEPILSKIKNFLEQSGYTFSLFNSLTDQNIEFKDISFVSQIKIKKNIKIKTYIGCLSTIFTVLKDTIKKRDGEITMKYKRVSNYNEMDSIESFITEQRKKDENPDQIIEDIVSNFNLSTEQAKQRFAKWASEVNVETDLFENKKITIRTNTGFPFTIKQDKSNFLTTFKTTDINDVKYIYHIFIFVDSLIRLIYDKDSSEVSSMVTELCTGKKFIDVPDTTEEEDIKQTEIKFVDEDKQQAFLGLFGATNPEDETGDFDDEGDIDFGDVEFGDVDDISEKQIQDKEEEFDFGDIEFGELDIGETPNVDDTGRISAKSKTPTPISPISDEINNETKKEIKTDSETSDTSSSIDVDLTGLRIEGNNNIFMQKREELQPKLFLKKKSGRYKAYSRACPSEYAKQPLILTSKEKAYIDKKDKEFGTQSYDEHITYGTGDTKYHYICPRFWCLSDDNGKSRSISFDEINSGKCGGWDALIPEGVSKVPDGGRIVQFTDKRFHKKGVNTKNIMVYKPFYPSFMGKDKHPDGLCIPCCFGKPTTIGKGDWVEKKDSKDKIYYENLKTGETTRKPPKIEYDTMYEPVGNGPGGPGPDFKRDQNGNIIMSSIVGKKIVRDKPAPSRLKSYNTCNQKESVDKIEEKEDVDEIIEDDASLLKGDEAPLLETFPHRFNQLGYLPLSVQKFIGYNSSKQCQISVSDTKLKMNNYCLLQKGVQASDNQSFLACIADAFSFIENYRPKDDIPATALKNKPDITIDDLKGIIKERLNFDIFVTLQNGDLIDIFHKKDNNDINIDEFKESNFYKTLTTSKNDLDTTNYLKKCANAYKNFIDYISSNEVNIDYEYLWDFLSLKREDNLGGMFSSGMNLIILNSPDDDITSKLELVCPTSMYFLVF